MAVLFFIGVTTAYRFEAAGNPIMNGMAVTQPLGNMEGKEVRFGIANSALFATVTTDASCGAVNSMHDSFTSIGGLVPLVNIQLGEVVFGGVGAGLYGMLVYGRLVGFYRRVDGRSDARIPGQEDRSAGNEAGDALRADLSACDSCLLRLVGCCALRRVVVEQCRPARLSEILYAYTSGAGNNGSAFAGLNANTPWYNVTLGLAMLVGRFLMIVPALAIAGSLVGKKAVPESLGTFPTNGALFVVLLVGVILIVGALTFFPALALGPIVEHFLAQAGKVY